MLHLDLFSTVLLQRCELPIFWRWAGSELQASFFEDEGRFGADVHLGVRVAPFRRLCEGFGREPEDSLPIKFKRFVMQLRNEVEVSGHLLLATHVVGCGFVVTRLKF